MANEAVLNHFEGIDRLNRGRSSRIRGKGSTNHERHAPHEKGTGERECFYRTKETKGTKF